MSGLLWNPLTGKYENHTPITTDDKIYPYVNEVPSLGGMLKGNESTSTDHYLQFTELGRIAINLHQSKEELCYKKLKKWLKKRLKGKKDCYDDGYILTLKEVVSKIKEFEGEQ